MLIFHTILVYFIILGLKVKIRDPSLKNKVIINLNCKK
ncbi:hypothetical protein CBN_1922 [Clostridium botulinum NCTC 2916]|uniref:Uncharacterized protein n=2 Tax=Clostridium botulinum TaxID=1491 RepID=C1FP44_CLOBJ|nr:hypothetical protein CLM_2033 [Clostridium botulinum A2 str. Kyoto]ACQ52857.1 hypothetical protein CLJ_B2045 [Clostridium botulinum Ba4 str. 657]EDT80750.1 hypothetical protein CBN_1922 [Clostridium botulinum NCTC 2916]